MTTEYPPRSESLNALSVPTIAERVASKTTTASDVLEACLDAIRAQHDLNAITFVAEREARAAAAEVDSKVSEGKAVGRLAGVPVIVKDAICTTDLPTTCGSRILMRGDDQKASSANGWRPPYDATVIERLRQEGAVVIAKANMDEFAMGSSNETSAYGPARNPWDPERTPGGSSGGSAVSVAAKMAPVALGSDTGGSIRQPASLCGVVGVKPSYGRVSRYGLIAFASSLDQIGPMTRDVRSSARVLEVMAGADDRDSTSSRLPVGAYEAACQRGLEGLRFGIPEEYFAEGIEPAVRERVEAAIDRVRAAGCEVRPVKLPHTEYGVATYYVVATAEASSNLARFDGIRFGLRVEKPGATLTSMYGDTRGRGFGAEVKRRILLGTYVLSAGYYDAYYGKAQRVRTLIRRDFERAFAEVDALLTPTSPTVAFSLGERTDDPLAMYLADVYTVPASLAGIAGISIPCGTAVPSGGGPGLPVGLQILCPAAGEETMFAAAAGIEGLLST